MSQATYERIMLALYAVATIAWLKVLVSLAFTFGG
jgi:hypothetical protein